MKHNLRSIRKFATKFMGVTLCVPVQERNQFSGPDFEDCEIVTYPRSSDTGKWQIQAQCQKCMADIHCPNADFILHTDSDCIFTEAVTPHDYFKDERPVMLIERFERLKGNPWKSGVDRALGIDAKYETMRRHPQVNPAFIYSAMRNHIGKLHRCQFEQYVMKQKSSFPWGFSEHCTIGAFALEFYPMAYSWIDVENAPVPKNKLVQYWSHSPPNVEQNSPTGAGRVVPERQIAEFLK